MKPYVSTFVFSDDVKEIPNSNGGTTMQVINPQNLFRPHFVPGTYSFAITFGLLEVDPDKKHKLSFQLISPNSNEAPLIDIKDAELPPNISLDSNLPKEANGFMFNMDFRNIAFRLEGKYTAQISLNGELLGEFPILVYPQEKI